MDLSIISEAFHLAKLIDFATRHNAHLDNIYSDIEEYTKADPQKLAPLVGNEKDHCCVFLPPSYIKHRKYIYKAKRSYKRDTKLKLAEALHQVDWTSVYEANDVHEKAEKFQTQVVVIANQICPLKKVRVREDNPKWETSVTSKIRRARNKAYSKGALRKEKYKHLSTVLRNMIDKNKKAQTNNIVNKLQNSDGNWWKNVASLTGKQQSSRPEHTCLDNDWLDNSQVADKLNAFFANVGGDLQDYSMLGNITE